MENRIGLVVEALREAGRRQRERHAALVMTQRHADRARKVTLGADKT